MNRLFTSYKYELKKLIVVRKGWIFLLCVILVQLTAALFVNPTQEYVFDKGMYAEYTELYGGEYSDEKASAIGEELQAVDQIANETDLMQVTDAEKIEELSQDMLIASAKQNVLNALQSKYAELSVCKEYHPILTYDLDLNEYISKFGINWVSLICMLFFIPMLMLGDKNSGMEQIIFPTSTGRKTVVSSKLIAGITLGLCITAVCSVIQILIMGIRWNFGSLSVPVQSLSGFGECRISLSILECMIICTAVQIISSVAFVLIISIFSSLLKKEPAVISAALILVLMSAFLAEKFSSVSMLFLFTQMSGISGIKTFSNEQLFLSCLILLLKTVILAVASRFIAGRKR